ncbi:uncharacterized protein LOC126979820 [Leptidea sinapis]|uniref:uncharacterized protein LOC126979820 n=1 Tax=Leptidea sinapis TaxID=189913 RepID=UPI0021230074|nr:uncharacterized protein LOC126979820 [Leptidea sinapis]
MNTASMSQSNSSVTQGSCNRIKAASAPVLPPKIVSSTNLKEQISAPSYFHSLKENEAPPFEIPQRPNRPQILIGTIVTEKDIIGIISIALYDGLNKALGDFVVAKKIIANYNLTEKKFAVSLMVETIEYAAQRDFNVFKLSCLMTLYLSTHMFFKWFYWLSPAALWNYFKEIMIRHTIEDSPDGQEVFEPEECFDILTHFHAVYMSNLPLVHILTFGVYRLKLSWPFKPK